MDGILTPTRLWHKLTGIPVRLVVEKRRAMSETVRPAPYRRVGAPFLGATLAYIRDPLRLMREQYDACGPVSELEFVGGRSTVLLGPDACAAALQNKDKAFANGPGWGEIVGPFFHRGLMLLDFEEHHRHRMLMQQAFTRPTARVLHSGARPGDRDRARRLGTASGLPGLSRPEVAHPRPGHPGVHGWCRAGVARRARAGEPRVRRLRAGGHWVRTPPAARHPLGTGDARTPPARGLLRPAPRGQA